MEIKYLNKLKDNFQLFKDSKPSSIEKIDALENELSIQLPKTVKEFLFLTGDDYDMMLRGGGGAKQGIENMDYIRDVSFNLLKSTGQEIKNIFPFLEYADQFLFYFLDEGDDPAVYRFETELFYCGDDYMPDSSKSGYPKGVSKVAYSFSSMINSVVDNKLKQQNT
ncbi:hypothetical protein BWK59_05570 [Flavobacterium davisii]|uniref:Knr4/Smi1-like domain-containing protein n=1 Tax=Flavobacterium davisii TaxID=2906077 RepID=A0A246GJE6_9FLAO|nr:SMI1/KNR4 family protein [Flavobacterium davisii]OWP84397.1 hypothetical protein BWK59_05570 [Flavobacterium davisii]